jgi:protein-S-isoprenylcysteine O-methyltransferase Ste14
MVNLTLLCILWIGWCAMHSLLIDTSVLGLVKRHLAGLTRYYRILYNGLSLVTFVPLLAATRMIDGPVIVVWQGYTAAGRYLLLGFALILFIGGARKYDLRYFLGLRQLRTGEDHLLLSETGEFAETGVFGVTRHPWYFGSLLFLWSMSAAYSLPVFLAVAIMSLYLVIGTVLEERKIVARYGDRYRRYQRQVSMLFPWKWLVGMMHGWRKDGG